MARKGPTPAWNSSVGIFIDGVYRARNGVALSDLGEVQQIEVLRGPQGTLFGRNTSAGLITVVTAGPNMGEFEFGGEATYGDYAETRLAGHISGPLVEDTLGFRLFGAVSQRDGFMDIINFTGGHGEANTRDLWTLRGQVLWTPSPNVEWRFIGDMTKRDEDCCAAMIYDPEHLNGSSITFPVSNPGAPPDDFLPTPAPGAAGAVALQGGYGAGVGNQAANIANLGSGFLSRRTAFANRPYSQIIDDWGFSGEMNWDIGAMTFTSLTAYRDWSYDNGGDIDFSAADLWYRTGDGSAGFGFKIFTQEFRLAGESGPINWLVGMFYSDEELERRDRITLGNQFNDFWRSNSAALFAPFDPTVGGTDAVDTALDGAFTDDRYQQNGNSLALFGHVIAAFSPQTHVSVGLRFTSEEKELDADFDTNFAGPFTSGAQFMFDSRAAIAGGAFAALLNSVGPAGVCRDFTSTAGTAALGSAQQVYCIGVMNPALDTGVFHQSREEEEFSGVLALHHEFSDMVSAYVSASRGYKAGGFNLDRNYDGYVQTGPNAFTITYNTGFEPEFVNAYELGIKTTTFGGALSGEHRLLPQRVRELPAQHLQRRELPIVVDPGSGLGRRGSRHHVAHADRRALVPRRLRLHRRQLRQRQRLGGAELQPVQPHLRALRLPGAQLTNAPEWTATGAATYERDIGNLKGLAYLDFRYVADQITGSDLNPSKMQPEYWLVNARLGIGAQDESWELEFWARNLFDEVYQQIAFDVPLQSGNANPVVRNYGAFLGDPRTAGVTLRVHY